jgi:pyridoxine 4-dehydrogenase
VELSGDKGEAGAALSAGDGVSRNERELGGFFPLGRVRVRRVGYGAMQLAGNGAFGRDWDEGLRLLRALPAAGVDHIDTAQFYGGGAVNQMIREALYPYPSELAIVSKVGVGGPGAATVSRLGRSIEENLNALGVGRLAAVNLRLMDPAETPDRLFDAELAVLIQAREEGLIDGIGLSNVSAGQLLRAVAQTEIVCVQNLFNLADQRSGDVLAACAERGIAFVPFFPLGTPGEARRRLRNDPVLVALAGRLGATTAQVMLAWLLDLAPNVLLIPGTRTQAHLEENLASASVELDDISRAELARRFPATNRRAAARRR